MKAATTLLIPALWLLNSIYSHAQESSSFFPGNFGIVLEDQGTKNVKVTTDITYKHSEGLDFQIDVYRPQGLKKNEKIPAVVFMNVATVSPGQARVRKNNNNTSWARLVAGNGMVGITIDVGQDQKQSFIEIFQFLVARGAEYNIDASRLGTMAFSANTIRVGNYLMSPEAYPGIKASVLYYGFITPTAFRKDLPMLFVVAEGDLTRNSYDQVWNEVLKAKAPWTVTMASDLPHAFDIFTDNDQSRILIKQTVSFLKDHLSPVTQPRWQKSVEREILESVYWHKDEKTVAMMKDWFKDHHEKDLLGYQNYASALVNTKRYNEALDIHRKRLEMDPTNTQILLDLIVVSHAMDNDAQAEVYWKDYTSKTTIQRSSYSNVAFALYNMGLYRWAAEYYEKAATFEARPITWFVIACCYAQTGNTTKAFEALDKAIAAGYGPKTLYEDEALLKPLHDDTRWAEALKKLNN